MVPSRGLGKGLRWGHLARRPECWARCPHRLQVAQVPRASVPWWGRARHARLVSSLLLDGDAIAWSWQQLTTCLQRWDSESKGELTRVHTRGHQPMWGPAMHHAQAGRNSLVALESVHTEMSCCGHSVPSAPDWGVGERQPSTEKPWGSEVPAQQVGRKLTCEEKRSSQTLPAPPVQKILSTKAENKISLCGPLGFQTWSGGSGPWAV